jgi:D-lyxose ketol-isomerase
MIDVKFLEQFIKTVGVDDPNYDNRCYMSKIGRISQTRMFGINLPRVSGKTTALEQYAKTRSALRFDGVKCRFVTSFGDNGYFDNLFTIGSFRGQRSNGMKYQCCVADEFNLNMRKEEVKNFFWQTIVDLKNANMLTDDFYILYLGTEVV